MGPYSTWETTIEVLIEEWPTPNPTMRSEWIHTRVNVDDARYFVVMFLQMRRDNMRDPNPLWGITAHPSNQGHPWSLAIGKPTANDIHPFSGWHTR